MVAACAAAPPAALNEPVATAKNAGVLPRILLLMGGRNMQPGTAPSRIAISSGEVRFSEVAAGWSTRDENRQLAQRRGMFWVTVELPNELPWEIGEIGHAPHCWDLAHRSESLGAVMGTEVRTTLMCYRLKGEFRFMECRRIGSQPVVLSISPIATKSPTVGDFERTLQEVYPEYLAVCGEVASH